MGFPEDLINKAIQIPDVLTVEQAIEQIERLQNNP